MPIAAGANLGPFVIRAPLGKGGMGQVYLAFDPRLGREVAIKVLPAGAVGNAERRARFVQEAKLASSLNHRNIVTIYDVDAAQADGQPLDFVAMEYVHGKTLDKLIGRKGLRLNEALRYAQQIADGLAAAHGAGIIHRDLKPANIIVNEQGEVKILDFGLAKLIEPKEADVWAATESVHFNSEAGTITGTAAYMSPEQAEAQNVDERSDIFSFGAVFYEMITGRRAFNGGSQLSTLAAVLQMDPAPIREAREQVPRDVERIIERCLRKDPRRRWQSAADLKIALEDVLEDVESGKLAAARQAGKAEVGSRWWVWSALILLALASGAFIGARYLTRANPTFQRLTYRRGDVPGARFAPDGTVIFSAQWATDPTRIFSLQPGRDEYRPLDLPNARILSISSSGELAILLGSATSGTPGTLARVPLSGGAPREILENVNDADWSPDGASIAVSRTVRGRNRIEYPIGTVLYESDGRPPLSLRVSRKGDLLAFFDYDDAVGDFAVAVLDTRGRKRILSRGWRLEGGLAWSPKGDEIWFSGAETGTETTPRAVKLNGDKRVITDAPAAIAIQDVDRSGRVLATTEDTRIGILGLAPGATEERDLSWFDGSWIYDISADGKQILFSELSYGKPRNPAIYLRETDGSPAIRLGDGLRPALSPDGKWVACIVSDGPQTSLTLLPTGAGVARTIGPPGMHYERVEWFPDGQRILFEGSEPNRRARTFVQELNGKKPAPLTPEGVVATRVSPDQKYATVVAGGRLSLFPIQGGAAKPIANLEPGERPIRWNGDGRFLFLRKLDGPASLTISRLDVMTGRRELWKELKPPDPVGVQIAQVAITPDGRFYAYSFQRDIVTLYLAQGLR
jgi:tRNA A-37 threonylcarbamoyl transferase component Bud32/Tol biopolymer transport system component